MIQTILALLVVIFAGIYVFRYYFVKKKKGCGSGGAPKENSVLVKNIASRKRLGRSP